jgi:hypothetical protein
MAYVALTAALFAAGAYLGRDLTGGIGLIAFIAAFACLIGMRFASRRSQQLTVGLLAGFGLLMGLATAPTLAYYASADPQALWQSGGATALFVAGFGAAGYATRRDLSALARILFWALVALIGFSIVLIFVNIPNGALTADRACCSGRGRCTRSRAAGAGGAVVERLGDRRCPPGWATCRCLRRPRRLRRPAPGRRAVVVARRPAAGGVGGDAGP